MATLESTPPVSTSSTAAKTVAKKPAPSTSSAAVLAAKKSVVATKRATVKRVAPTADLASSKSKLAAAAAPSPSEIPLAVTPEAKPAKEKKPKMVRDSLTIPKTEYQALDVMKHRAADLKVMVKKTELIRAGIKLLSTLPDAAFLAALAAVPSLKTGRPSKD